MTQTKTLNFEISQRDVARNLVRESIHIILDGERMLTLTANEHNKHVSDEQKDFMQKICSAVNNTYGMGYDATYVNDIYTSLEECRNFIVDNIDKLPNSETVRLNALKALKNSKP